MSNQGSAIPRPGNDETSGIVEAMGNQLLSGQDLLTNSEYASTYLELLIAMTIAATMAALIAYHPRRTNGYTSSQQENDVKKTQILICVAGALLIPLIEGSLARAFALAGLGSFVRYRTALRSPMDLSIIFILIGIGMACGIKRYDFAIIITGFIYVLMYVMELGKANLYTTWAVRINCDHPSEVRDAFGAIARENDFHIERQKTNTAQGSFRCFFTSKRPLDTEEISQEIKERVGNGTVFQRFDWDRQRAE